MEKYKSIDAKHLIYESYDRLLNDWGVPYEEHDIQTSYGITHIVTAGSPLQPPLLLLHGTADNSAMMWIFNAQALSEHFYLIAVDAIGGSGKSEANDAYFKTFDQARWLDELLEQLKLDKVNVAGVSYGAYLAYHYAIVRPDKANKIICMAGRIPSSQTEVMFKMMKAFLPEALFPSEANCRKLLRKLSGPNYIRFENHAELMKHWYYLLKYFNNKSMMKHTITIFNDEQLNTLREKALFLIGEHDRMSYYPKAISKLQMNGINYRLFKDAGHAINHEIAEQINAEIIAFLS